MTGDASLGKTLSLISSRIEVGLKLTLAACNSGPEVNIFFSGGSKIDDFSVGDQMFQILKKMNYSQVT